MENSTNGSSISPPAAATETPVWYYSISSVISVVAICGNTLVAYLILTRRRLRVTANWFIFSLAFADLFVGLFITPTVLACHWLPCDKALKGLFEEFFLYASVCNLCAMTLDRYIAVSYPLKYFLYMSTKRVGCIVCSAWVLPLVNTLLHFSWLYSESSLRARWQMIFTMVETFLFIILPCVVLLLVNIRIFMVVKKHAAQTAFLKQQLEFNRPSINQSSNGETGGGEKSDQVSNSEMSNKETSSPRKRRRLLRAQSDRKSAAKLIGTVVTLFILCWLVSIYVSLCYFLGVCRTSPTTQRVAWFLMLLNSAVNPVVYAFLKTDLSRELALVFHCTG